MESTNSNAFFIFSFPKDYLFENDSIKIIPKKNIIDTQKFPIDSLFLKRIIKNDKDIEKNNFFIYKSELSQNEFEKFTFQFESCNYEINSNENKFFFYKKYNYKRNAMRTHIGYIFL